MRWRRQPTDDSRKKDLAARRAALERELAEAEEQQDDLAKAVALNNLGTVFADLEEWADALERYEQSAVVVPATASLEDRATPHGNAANAARRLDLWSKSLEHALWVDALAVEAADGAQRTVADAAVALVRRHLPDAEFATLMDEAVAALPEAMRGLVRQEQHLHPTVINAVELGRNDPCHCGSGKKYKHCHMKQDKAEA